MAPGWLRLAFKIAAHSIEVVHHASIPSLSATIKDSSEPYEALEQMIVPSWHIRNL